MTLALATIPDNTDALSGWLERHIVSPGLRELVSELSAVHNAQPPTDSVRNHIGPWLREVLTRGLSVLPHTELRHLLRQPHHLLELQELVLLEGGPYWDTISRPDEFTNQFHSDRERLETALFGALAESASSVPVTHRSSWKRTFWTIATTAALVCVGTLAATHFLIPPPASPTPETVWGWAKADAFPKNLDRAAYLNHLADEADEWFAKRPTDASSAAKRIAEFREGCTALLMTDHTSLTPADQVWLKERCRAWRKVFDDELAHLEDTGDVNAALTAVDATTRKLRQALRARATTS